MLEDREQKHKIIDVRNTDDDYFSIHAPDDTNIPIQIKGEHESNVTPQSSKQLDSISVNQSELTFNTSDETLTPFIVDLRKIRKSKAYKSIGAVTAISAAITRITYYDINQKLVLPLIENQLPSWAPRLALLTSPVIINGPITLYSMILLENRFFNELEKMANTFAAQDSDLKKTGFIFLKLCQTGFAGYTAYYCAVVINKQSQDSFDPDNMFHTVLTVPTQLITAVPYFFGGYTLLPDTVKAIKNLVLPKITIFKIENFKYALHPVVQMGLIGYTLGIFNPNEDKWNANKVLNVTMSGIGTFALIKYYIDATQKFIDDKHWNKKELSTKGNIAFNVIAVGFAVCSSGSSVLAVNTLLALWNITLSNPVIFNAVAWSIATPALVVLSLGTAKDILHITRNYSNYVWNKICCYNKTNPMNDDKIDEYDEENGVLENHSQTSDLLETQLEQSDGYETEEGLTQDMYTPIASNSATTKSKHTEKTKLLISPVEEEVSSTTSSNTGYYSRLTTCVSDILHCRWYSRGQSSLAIVQDNTTAAQRSSCDYNEYKNNPGLDNQTSRLHC